MKLYEAKIIDRGMNKRFRKRAESRDAVVWDIDEANKIVRCKIQGSNEYILCHYPRNWQTLPPWCKRGNAVRIAHKGGVRGYMEVSGHGRAVPSPVSGDQLPETETLYDGVLTGGAVWALPGMRVRISLTTFRIDGVTYSTSGYASQGVGLDGMLIYTAGAGAKTVFDAILIQDAKKTTLDAQLESPGTYELTFATAPAAPNGRYDLIVVGSSGVPYVVQGAVSSTDPVMPSTPADHVKIAHVMIIGGMTSITDSHINAKFETRKAIQVAWALANGTGVINEDDEFVWHISNSYPYCRVTLDVLDQYGFDLYGPHVMTIEFISGSGGIALSAAGPFISGTIVANTNTQQGIFYYQRDQTGTEYSPILQVTVDTDNVISIYRIQLLNSLGDQI